MNDAFGCQLGRADRLHCFLENGLNLFAGGLIFALMLLGVAQIVLRTVFDAPIFGYIDIVEVAMVGFAVLSIAFVQRVGGHVRMELVIGRLRGRWLWCAEAVGAALAAFIVGVLIPYSWRHFGRTFQFGDSTIDIELATWPADVSNATSMPSNRSTNKTSDIHVPPRSSAYLLPTVSLRNSLCFSKYFAKGKTLPFMSSLYR